MSTVTLDGNSLASIIAAVGGAMAAIITALNRRTARTTETKVDSVHSEVKTANGDTLAQLVETKLVPTVETVAAATVPERNESPAPG
jgi:hypothetical protein